MGRGAGLKCKYHVGAGFIPPKGAMNRAPAFYLAFTTVSRWRAYFNKLSSSEPVSMARW